MQLTRRKLLATAAPAAAFALAGCSSTQIATAEQDWANFVDQVNKLLAGGCSLLPGFVATANTISAVVTALYPTIGAAIAAGSSAVQAVANAICGAIPANPPVSLRRKLKASSPALPVHVGDVTIGGKPIPIIGYQR